jgi:Protein of unknown function (DUF1236)
MKTNRITLLAGAATFALIVGTGFASAQDQQQKDQHAAPQANQPHATQPMHDNANGMRPEGANRAAPNPGPAAQQTPKNEKDNGRVGQSGAQPGAGATNRGAQGVNRNNKSNNEGTTAQERHIPQDLQGNASGQMQGANVSLSTQQRTQIRRTVINARGAPRVRHVDFDVRVGTEMPRDRIHIIPVPETLVQIDAGWRDFLYFVYEDEVVIVDPSDMRIVAILPV